MKKIFQFALVISNICYIEFAYAAINIPFTVNLSESVVVTGTPRVALDVGGTTRYATYTSGTGTSSLIFTYTMTVGDVDLDGITLVSPLQLNGGTIKDLSGNDANLTFTLPNTSNVKANYPSLGMDFVADADGRYTLNGTVYNDLLSFLTAAGGTYTRSTTATYFNSSGVMQSAASGVPRFDYDPIALTAKGMLFEETRTNLLLRSTEFDNASWAKTGAFVTANTTTAPDGTMTADKLIGNNTVSTRKATGRTATVTAGTRHTYTIFLKSAEFSTATIWFDSTNVSEGAYYGSAVTINLNTGTSSNSSIVSVTNVGNGWYRCALTATPTAVSMIFIVSIGAPNGGDGLVGDGASGIFVWGGQVEAGTYPTSFIPTTTATVTRNADVLSIPTGSWYNQSEGTFFNEVSWVSSSGTNFPMFFRVDDTTNANRWNAFYNQGANTTGIDGFNSGALQGSWNNPASISGTVKVAGVQSLNNANTSFNGVLKTLDTGWSPPTVTRLIQDGAAANKSIKTIRYYPVRITDTQLQLLSQ